MAYDAFSVLCRGVEGSDAALRIADRIARSFEHPIELAGRAIFVRPNVGIALRGTESTPTTLLRDADAAKYEAKAAGGAASAVCTEATRAAALDRLELHNDLHRALECGELSLRYQPIVSLTDGSLAGVEALLRWHHPVRGEIAPDDFVPLAESSGLIVPIGEWVLAKACAQLADWGPLAEGLVMSVNLSAPQVLAPGLLDAVAGAVATARVDPGSICLELTERAFLNEPDYVADTMTGLNQLGVQLALDDFGTGYSSLRWLAEIPLDVLKVDRTFVAALNSDDRGARVAETILRLGSLLDMEAVGEGIEDASQVARLRALGCTHGQGYLFAPPLTPDGVDWWLRRRRVGFARY
jgi:EAL domain-containing protein (putative c-di-GMP-specific phosphodiesterase class I)